MALQYFEVERGFKTSGAIIMAGAGAPHGTDDTGTAPVGSIYLDTTNGGVFYKTSVGVTPENWVKSASTQDVMNASWREPVEVIDETSTTLPTGGSATITVDGQTIANDERVLFTNLTTDPNVYIYDETFGSFIPTINQQSVGDFVYIRRGSKGGTSYVYAVLDDNVSQGWIQSNSTTMEELDWIRTFIGKTEGDITPEYATNYFVSNGDSLQTAVSALDNQTKTNADGLATEITDRAAQDDVIELNAGLNTDGTYNTATGANYISTATSIHNATTVLDAELKLTNDEVARIDGVVVDNVARLDRAYVEAKATNISTETTVDSIKVDKAAVVNWTVYVQETASPANRRAVQLSAVHNGTIASDATQVEYNKYSIVQSGTEIAGLSISVDQSGSADTQYLNLKVDSTNGVDAAVVREIVRFPSLIA